MVGGLRVLQRSVINKSTFKLSCNKKKAVKEQNSAPFVCNPVVYLTGT